MTTAEKSAVAEVTEQFYVALNAMFKGDLDLMRDVWSHADDVVYMGPSGKMRIGWADVLADWEAQAEMMLGGEVTPTNMRFSLGQDLAVTHGLEVGANVDSAGKPLPVSIRATNVFRKEDDVWKMIGHHTDLLPFIKE